MAWPVRFQQEFSLAEEAREQAKVERLFDLYKKARQDSLDLLRAMSTVMEIGNEKIAAAAPVEALERIAHEALGLVREFLRSARSGGSDEQESH